jgi:hypothetical protein
LSDRTGPIWTEIERLERAAAAAADEAWRSADAVRDAQGKRITLRRSARHVTIEVSDGVARMGPDTLRTIAAVLLSAAKDIEAGR